MPRRHADERRQVWRRQRRLDQHRLAGHRAATGQGLGALDRTQSGGGDDRGGGRSELQQGFWRGLAGAQALATALTEEFEFRFLVGVLGVLEGKDVGGMLVALEPVFNMVVVTDNGSPRALDVESLALRAEEVFGPDRVLRASTLPDALEVATALVEDGSEGYSGSGIVVTGSVVTAGAARTLFGKDPS